MSKRDVLDREAARKMAWSRTLPAAADPAAEPAAVQIPLDPAEERRRHDANAELAAHLEQRVEELWAMESPDLQARAVQPLAERVAGIAFGLAAMSGGNTSIRLARLIVRHYRSLPVSVREPAAFALFFARLSGPELPELLIETALLGDSWVSGIVERCLGDAMHVEHPSLGARLADVMDGAPSYESRRIALHWLSAGRFPDAVPALRRRLREPYLGLRWPALSILLDLRGECPGAESIAHEDIAWLLEDAVIHPPSCEVEERARTNGWKYEEVLLRAVRELPPAGGERPLMRIARSDCAHWDRSGHYLDAGWAIRALAAGYPDRAMAVVDERMRDASSYRREDAAEALDDLRWVDAEPRLRIAAVDPAPRVAEVARRSFERRSGTTWTSHALDGLPLELLDAPASKALIERATVIRAQGREGRDAMAAMLLAEAPAREALLATLLLLAEGTTVYAKREGLPHQREWGPALVEHWGDAGARGVLWLARAYPHGLGGWVHPLVDVMGSPSKHAIVDDARALAVELLRADGPDRAPAAYLLGAAGITASNWRNAWDALGDPSIDWNLGGTLARCEPSAELDEQLVAEADRALAAGEIERLTTMAYIGLERELPGIVAIVKRALVESEGADLGTLVQLANEQGLVDAAWRLEALRQPESTRFAAAVSQLPYQARATAEEERALRDALHSTARDGVASIDAAIGLFRGGALGMGDAELSNVLDRAPLAARVPLLDQIALHLDGAADFLWPHVEAILRSDDTATQEAVLSDLFSFLREDEWLERLRPIFVTMPEGEPRELLAYTLREPSAATRYWRDPPEVDEEKEEEEKEEDGLREAEDDTAADELAHEDGDGLYEGRRCIAPLDGDALCGAPAVTTRLVAASVCGLCAEHAAELDAEQDDVHDDDADP